jgi:CheY-like chemotaxis protein
MVCEVGMARLLIVSRSMALAMRLADQHDVVEHSADELDGLLTGIDADVLVLDVGDPVLAVNTVNSLREAEQDIPVLLVSGYQPEWEQVEAQQVEGVHVVPLPITRIALLYGISELTGENSPINFVNSDDVAPPAAAAATQPIGNGEMKAPEVAEVAAVAAVAKPKPAASPATAAPTATPPAATPPSVSAPTVVAVPSAAVPSANSAGVAAATSVPETLAAAARLGPDAPTPTRSPHTAPSHARNRANPANQTMPPISTGEVPALTESEVAGLSYSSSITRPFGEEPPTGSFPLNIPQPPPARPTQRWSRNSSQPVAPAPAEPQPGDPGPATPRRMPRLGPRPRKLQRNPTNDPTYYTPPSLGLVTDPLGPRTDPYGFPSSALDRRLDAEAASLVSSRPVTGDNGVSLRTGDLVRLLHQRAGDLYGVSDTAQVLADDVIERADADAAAILVPDGPVWRVSGGVGLRPLERRLVLEDSHWLITEIGSAGRAVLIEDTDIIRQQLSGAPLAAWRHLLAVPVPDVRAIVVLARGQEGGPFTDRDLSAVIAPVREAAALLAQAVQTRRLARALGPLQESEGDPPRRSPEA